MIHAIHKDFGTKINEGFFNHIYRSNQSDIVIKVPKITSRLANQTYTNICKALDIHNQYLGNWIPKTKIISSKESTLGYVFEQQYIAGNPLSTEKLYTHEDIKKDLMDLLQAGTHMQKDTKLFFDPYGMSDYLKNIYRLSMAKPLTLGNIIIDKEHKLYYVDVGYIRTDRIGLANNILTELMNNLGGIS